VSHPCPHIASNVQTPSSFAKASEDKSVVVRATARLASATSWVLSRAWRNSLKPAPLGRDSEEFSNKYFCEIGDLDFFLITFPCPEEGIVVCVHTGEVRVAEDFGLGDIAFEVKPGLADKN